MNRTAGPLWERLRGLERGLPRGVALGIAVAGLVAYGALRSGVAAGLPEDARLALALFALILLPGFALVALGGVPPGGAWLSPMWALGFGVLINSLLIGFAAGATLDGFGTRWLVSTLVLWALAMVPRASAAASGRGLGRAPWALALVILAALLAAVHVGQLGTPVFIGSDSPDHIGTVRRIMTTGHAFPLDAFFKDAGALGADPRKGIWHPQVALIARLAGVDAATAWIRLSAMIAPLFILNAAAFGFVAAGSAGAAATAWALLLVWSGSLAWCPLRKAVFATFLNDQVAFAACTALLADLTARRASTRATAMLLAAAAGAIHVFAAIQLALAGGALAIGLAVRDRGAGPVLRRHLGTLALMALACAALLLPRIATLHAPRNLIHTEPQGLLLLGGGLRVVSIGVMWDWMQQLWVLFPLAWVPLWRHARGNPAALFLLTTSLGVPLVIFNPLAVAWLEPRLGYLLMRMVWMVPIAGLIGFGAVTLARAARDARGARRIGASLALAGLLLVVLPTARDAGWAFTHAADIRRSERETGPLRWSEPMAWMRAHLAPDDVVLSDPATSYAIPMMSGQFVVTMLDQHSSPADTLALRRILDARDALDPYADWAHTRALIARHGATVVVLNGQFDGTPRLDYWAPSRNWFAEARARLDARPAAFRPLYDRDDFVIYRVDRAALDSLQGGARVRPFVRPFVTERAPIGHKVSAAGPALLRLALEPRIAAPGDTLRGMAEWRATGPLPAGSWQVPVRFDRALPAGITPPPWIAKPVRKLIERVHGERYRFREDHLPASGAYGVDLWRSDEVVQDSFDLVVPADVAEGLYQVEVTMFRQPHYPNYGLRDYFQDEDYYAGIAAGTLTVARHGGRGAHP